MGRRDGEWGMTLATESLATCCAHLLSRRRKEAEARSGMGVTPMVYKRPPLTLRLMLSALPTAKHFGNVAKSGTVLSAGGTAARRRAPDQICAGPCGRLRRAEGVGLPEGKARAARSRAGHKAPHKSRRTQFCVSQSDLRDLLSQTLLHYRKKRKLGNFRV